MKNLMNKDLQEDTICVHHFSWSAVIIGALVSIGLGFLLDLFGKAIGLSLYTNDSQGATILAVGGLLGLIIASIVTMFVSGFSAGYFAAPFCNKKNYGVVYGFLAWCLGLILMALLSLNVEGYVYNKSNTYTASHVETEMKNTSINVSKQIHPLMSEHDTTAEKEIKTMGMMSLALFFLFFIGAVSASFGGHYGYHCWHKKEEDILR